MRLTREARAGEAEKRLQQQAAISIVARKAIPIRVWCWPGNTNDQELIR